MSETRTSDARVSFGGVFRSELLKLTSLRSTVLVLLSAMVLIVGLSILISYAVASSWEDAPPLQRQFFDPVFSSLGGVFMAQLATGALGVLVFSGEYSTGQIRSTFTAVPRRTLVMVNKILVFGLVVFVLMLPAVLVAFLVGQEFLSSTGQASSLGEAGVVRALLGAAGYLTLVGFLGAGLGALLRSTPGGVSTLFGVLLVLPLIVNFLPSSWSENISPYLPSSAGQSLLQTQALPGFLSPLEGLMLFSGYVLLVLLLAALLLVRRDA